MRVLGVKLHLPTTRGLVVLIAMTLVCSAIAMLTAFKGDAPAAQLRMMVAAGVGGSLAAVCGCTVPEYGYRAIFLIVLFSASTMGICAVLSHFAGLA